MWSHSQSGQGILSRELGNTTPSFLLTTPLANSHIHLHNCKGQQAWVVRQEQLASLALAAELSLEVQCMDIPCGEPCSTMPSCQDPTAQRHQLHNCKDRLPAQDAWDEAWALALVLVEVVLGVALGVQLVWWQGMLLWHSPHQLSYSNTASSHLTTASSNWPHPGCNRKAEMW